MAPSPTAEATRDLSKVSQFRSEWKDGPRSSAKKLERLRAFFRFAQKRKWVTENPALDLKARQASKTAFEGIDD